jgi:hypothetical protein
MASCQLIDLTSMELAIKFRRGNLHAQLQAMRAAMLYDGLLDIRYICDAAGIRPEVLCILFWVQAHDPAIIALRAAHYPNVPFQVDAIYV